MDIVIDNVDCFDLGETLDCGQAFRWKENPDGSWSGIANKKYITLQKDNNRLILKNTTNEDYESFWKNYFDFDRDYTNIKKIMKQNPTLFKMLEICPDIRVLNQEPWEALCSFIISQNNNIKRIKGIVERLCEMFGEKIEGGYAFPEVGKIASLTLEDLAPLRSGFRAKYILDAARKVADGTVDFNEIKNMDINSARNKLTEIYGVGEKVADCTLLFGLGFSEAFPKDVWIKRAMPILFPCGLPENTKNVAGIIQQYIFSYARKTKLDI